MEQNEKIKFFHFFANCCPSFVEITARHKLNLFKDKKKREVIQKSLTYSKKKKTKVFFFLTPCEKRLVTKNEKTNVF